MKEVLLDLVEMAPLCAPAAQKGIVDFGVVGPGPRRTLNYVANRYWFDNEEQATPASQQMYVEELRDFQRYLVATCRLQELHGLNLLGVQFGLCKASKYLYHLEFERGAKYVAGVRSGVVAFREFEDGDVLDMRAVWRTAAPATREKLQGMGDESSEADSDGESSSSSGSSS